MMTLDIAIITYKPEGIKRLATNNLPRIDGVNYVVSWQAHESAPVPEELQRQDIKIYRYDGMGQSGNRNNGLDKCYADIIMTSDDDIIFDADGIRELIKTYEQNQKIDFIAFQAKRHGAPEYPRNECKLSVPLPKNYHVACFELSFRRKSAGRLRACPELGLNSPRYHGGEDEMLLITAIRRGLNCWFYPITVCSHDHPSTGSKSHLTSKNLQANGCVITLTYPRTAFLRIPLKAWRVCKAGQSTFIRALFYLSRGAIGAPGLLKRNKEYLY